MIRAMKFVVGLLLLAGTASLASTPATPVTQVEVDRWLQIWQKRLALDDWKIAARIVRQNDLSPETIGHLKWSAKDHTADIEVLDPLDYDMPAEQISADIERTVVHELIHLELSALPRNGSKRVEEQVVVRMTEALLGLDHGDNYAARAAGAPVQPRIKHATPGPVAGGNVAARSK